MQVQKAQSAVSASILWSWNLQIPPRATLSLFETFPNGCLKARAHKKSLFQTGSCTRGNSPVNTIMFNPLDFSNILECDHFREGEKRHLPALAMIDFKTV